MSKTKVGIDHIAKIKAKPHAKVSTFIFDARTKTIRVKDNQHFVLSNKLGKGAKPGQAACFRRADPKKITADQELTIGAHTIKNNKSKNCLSALNDKNAEE